MNYSCRPIVRLFFLSLLIIVRSVQAEDNSLFSWLFSSINKEGTISLIKKTDDGGCGVNAKGFASFVILTYVAVKIANTVTEHTANLIMPALMNYCPIKEWRDSYQRREEEKQLDKELAIAAFEEKREKVKKIRERQLASSSHELP